MTKTAEQILLGRQYISLFSWEFRLARIDLDSRGFILLDVGDTVVGPHCRYIFNDVAQRPVWEYMDDEYTINLSDRPVAIAKHSGVSFARLLKPIKAVEHVTPVAPVASIPADKSEGDLMLKFFGTPAGRWKGIKK